MAIDPTTGKEIPLIINREDGGQTPLVQNPNQPTGIMRAGITVPPPASTTISTDTIGTQPLQFPQDTTPALPAFPMTQTPTIDQQAQQFAQTQTQQTETEKTQTGLMSRFTQLQEKLFGKAPAQAQAEQAQGIPQKTQVVTDIQSQINQLQNESTIAQQKLQAQGGLASVFRAESTEIERDRTIKALQLNSFLYAANGNLATAQMIADKAIKAQFDPIEAKINYVKEFLDMNEKVMSREDKKKADALKIQLDERTRLLDEQKTEKQAINSIAIEAAQAGADANMLNKINGAKTQEEALQIAASDPNLLSWAKQMKDTQLAMDLQQQQFTQELAVRKFEEDKRQFGAEYALKVESQRLAQNKLTEDIRQFNAQLITPEGVNPEQLSAYGAEYASSGKLPSPSELEAAGLTAGQVATYAKEMPKENGVILDKNTGTAPDTAETLINAMSAIYSATELAKQLKEMNKQRVTGLLPAMAGKVFGSSAQQRYIDLKQQITDLLARARTGAAMTVSEEKFYGDMLPGRVGQIGGVIGVDPQVRIDNFIKNLSNDLKNKASVRGWVIQGLSTVKLNGKDYIVGQEIEINGMRGRVLPDGSISI